MQPRTRIPSLQELIDQLVPSHPVSVRHEVRADSIIDWKKVQNVTYKKQAVTRVILICSFVEPHGPREGYLGSRVILTINNRHKIFIFASQFYEELQFNYFALYSWILSKKIFMQCPLGNSFKSFYQIDRSRWENADLKYFDNEREFYEVVRKKVGVLLQTAIPLHKLVGVRLVSLGCALGHDLQAANDALAALSVVRENIGMDISSASLQKARELHPAYQFFEADIKNLASFMANYPENSQLRNVIIAVGCLTRMVQSGSLEALAVFQEALHCSVLLAVAGLTIPLITVETAEAIGWEVHAESQRFDGFEKAHVYTIYVLSYPDTDWLKLNLGARYNRQTQCLDLALSGNPVLHLQFFAAFYPAIKDLVETVDLTFALLGRKGMLAGVFSALHRYKGLKEIYYNDAMPILHDTLRFVKTETRLHFKGEVPFNFGLVEKLLAQEHKPVNLAHYHELGLFGKSRAQMNYLQDLKAIVGREVELVQDEKDEGRLYLSKTWLKQLSDEALDELAEGRHYDEATVVGGGIDREVLRACRLG
jgi:hypothetical protein